jgi:AraC family transcriptional activator of pobA
MKDIPQHTLNGAFAVGPLVPQTGPFRNAYYTIYWITKGEARISIDTILYTAAAPALVFVAPGQVQQMQEPPTGVTATQEPGTAWQIGFTETFYCLKDESAGRLFFNPDFATVLTPDPADEESLKALLDLMRAEADKKAEQFDNAFFALLQVFLIKVSRIMDKEESGVPDAGPFLQFRQLIEQHYKEKKNVSDYARMLNMTPVCLNAVTKQASGQTAGEQIRNYIILEAKRLLHSTTLTAKEVAYRLGFEDAPYFSRFFKKYTGQTLLEFREKSRKSTLLT